MIVLRARRLLGAWSLGLFAQLLLAGTVAAQTPKGVVAGDSLRVRIGEERRFSGRLVSWTQDTVVLRQRVGEQRIPIQSVATIERWKKTPVARVILGSAAAGGLLWGILSAAGSAMSWTGSTGGDVLVGAGIGAVFGIVWVWAEPSSWKTIYQHK